MHKYVLWCAETGTGFYQTRPSADKKNAEEQKSLFVGKNVSNVADGLVLKVIKPAELEPPLSDLHLTAPTLDSLYETCSAVKAISRTLQSDVAKIFMHDSSIIKEVCALDKLLYEQLFSKLTPEATARFTKWVEKVLSAMTPKIEDGRGGVQRVHELRVEPGESGLRHRAGRPGGGRQFRASYESSENILEIVKTLHTLILIVNYAQCMLMMI